MGQSQRSLSEATGGSSSCLGVGQEFGQRASRLWQMPLFAHKGSLSCTGLERGVMLGPSMCVGTGNLWARGFLQGWCWSPYPPGLVSRWWAWLCMAYLELPFPLVLVSPVRQCFSKHREHSLSEDSPHPTRKQDSNGWSLAGMPGPSEKEKGRVGAQIGRLRGSGKALSYKDPFRGQ